MRDRLHALPVWLFLLLNWVSVTVLLFIALTIQFAVRPVDLDPSATWKLLIAAVSGLLIAAPLTWSLKQRWRLQDRAMGDAPVDVRRAAAKAAWKGPVPADPEVRAAALRLAEEHLAKTRKARVLVFVGVGLVLISAVASAVTGSPWRLLFVALYVPLLVTVLRAPGRLRRRIAQLSEPE
ncbi:hypothetical protein [Kribbella sp. NPDC051620]|uniref:hypothetical protein n=1 Tax=Kribbella sp. NPDC051620 TaxID=3364120 RepID=UPI00379EB952